MSFIIGSSGASNNAAAASNGILFSPDKTLQSIEFQNLMGLFDPIDNFLQRRSLSGQNNGRWSGPIISIYLAILCSPPPGKQSITATAVSTTSSARNIRWQIILGWAYETMLNAFRAADDHLTKFLWCER